MNERPDYILCIDQNDIKHKLWCGREHEPFELVFIGLDHAALNGLQKGRLVACTQCVNAAVTALRNGAADDRP